MPRTVRERLIRFHDQAQNDLDRASVNLRNMANVYENKHPSHLTMIEQITRSVVQVKTLLRRFRDEMM